MRPRAAALAAVLLAVVVFAGCGDDEGSPAASVTATPSASASASPSASATAPADAATDQALWPDPAEAGESSPEDVARAFVEEFVGLEDPELGEFQAGEPRVGEIAVHRRGEDGRRLPGLLATISLRQLDGEHWFVTSAQSPEVEITAPEPLATISSPVTISGRGRGFEGNIVLEVREAFATEPLVLEPVTAGAMEELEPFEAELAFTTSAQRGAILARTGSGLESANGFTAFPVGFGG